MTSRVFPGEFSSLEKISEYIEEEAQKTPLEDSGIYEIQLAVDEACSNIIEHAYEGKGGGEIICTCLIGSDSFTVILEDEGKQFNPEEIKELKVGSPLEELGHRGAGVFLMRMLMDEVKYEFPDDVGTKLTLVKKF